MQQKQSETGIVPLILVVVNVIGILIGYAITILLARSLSHDGFEQYIGAVATLGLFASLGEGGFGKYALKVIPAYVAAGEASLLVGYLRFALLGSLITSLLLGLIAAAIEIPLRTGSEEKVILLAIVFLPAMAGAGILVDLLLAFRLAATATCIARILVPLTTLALIIFQLKVAELTPFRAVLCFSAGSVIGLLLSLTLCWLKTRSVTTSSRATLHLTQWMGGVSSFFVFGFLTTWIFRASLVITHHLPDHGDELAMLAPAFETGCLILLLSKSTDKFFQPTMSIVMQSSDWDHGAMIRRKRYIMVGCGVMGFLAIIFFFGKRILGFYGRDFESAYLALCLIAIGSSVWTLFSLSPTFLMFAGERKKLLISLLVHGTLMAVLTVVLLQSFGVTGAATAYTISISSLAITNLLLANRKFNQLRASQEAPALP